MTTRRVTATAPVRICDVGGWTDTWFGSPGQVCSLAVSPGVTVTAEVQERSEETGDEIRTGRPVHLVADDIGLDHWFGPSSAGAWSRPTPTAAPLLEHAVAHVLDEAERRGAALAPGQALTITITSAVPPGASLGTSAAVVVAVMGAVGGLLLPDDLDAPATARAAHLVETERAGREAGVQDHWAAAVGGPLHLVIDTYPDVRWSRIEAPAGVLDEVGRRLVTVVFGPHDSSAVHGEVIQALLSCDGAAHDRVRREIRALSSLAGAAAAALQAGDLDRWTEVLVASTASQARMHPGLVGPAHARAIAVARDAGATGWKVNGAGGDGGSLTVVAPGDSAHTVRAALAATEPDWHVLDLRPTTRGTTVSR